ncbi:hypothetical protein [Prevotella sp. P6B4]|uniref:hypothetical protein n=1 Tax=Prevotella sp. P6B4 TaxID=1410614 RepID=UPI000685FB29|nr:hypothetical protein [Prevotella sp. P6B4]
MEEETALELLRKAIEEKAGRSMRTPKDFDILSEYISDETHQKVSASTLKRFWGYLSESSVPRVSTLDILAQYVGYTDWTGFMEQDSTPNAPKDSLSRMRSPLFWGVLAVCMAVVAVVFFLLGRQQTKTEPKPVASKYVLTIGQKFKSHQDYLDFFGIHNAKVLYGQPVPNHPNIWTWGPTYHHRNWHNEGDSARMLPTITEYWTGEGATKEATAIRNTQQYFHYLRLNELRIAFVKNLVDSNFVFTGVYRMSLELSDTTKLVWERVANEVDLNNLDYLETLRNDISLSAPGSPYHQ